MVKKLLLIIALLGVMVAAGAALAQTDETEPTIQTTEVHKFADGAAVEDSFALLNRYENGLTAAISTADLTEGDVYTVWWVFFNEPQNCTDGACSEDDIFTFDNGELVQTEDGNFQLNFEGIENAGVSIQHAAGGYAVDDTLNTSATLGIGDVPGIVVGNGLLDPIGAEVHLVVRTHGQMVEAAFAEQISTFGGGCDPIMAAPCQDVQFSVFPPIVQ